MQALPKWYGWAREHHGDDKAPETETRQSQEEGRTTAV